MDLEFAYHKVWIKEEDIKNIAFKTKQGECLVIPFVSINAPITFMHIMNDVLHPFIDSFSIVYMYDFLILGSIWEEHVVHMK